jgi:acetyltransferase-like isoleucine patch superfamily enzyme
MPDAAPVDGRSRPRRVLSALRYLPLDARLSFGKRLYGIEYVNRWLIATPSRRATHHVLRRFGARLAMSASVPTHLVIDNAVTGDYSHLAMGRAAYLGKACFLDLVEPISVGDAAAISGGCLLLTHADPGTGKLLEQTYFPRETGPVTVGANAWLGAGVIVLPGVTVGECSVVGAGSVVVDDVEPFTVVAGSPARLIRRLPPLDGVEGSPR